MKMEMEMTKWKTISYSLKYSRVPTNKPSSCSEEDHVTQSCATSDAEEEDVEHPADNMAEDAL